MKKIGFWSALVIFLLGALMQSAVAESGDPSNREQAYQSAMQMYYAGKFSEAAQAFETLEGYKDSASKAAEVRRKQVYMPNLPWTQANSANNPNGYIIVMVDERFADEDMQKLARSLRDAYGIPCVMVRTDAAEALERFDAMSDGDVVGVVACGESWNAFTSLANRCTDKSIPLWCSEKSTADDLLTELAGLWTPNAL